MHKCALSYAAARLIGAFWRQAASMEAFCWVGRVPSECNIADPPSRGVWPRVREGSVRDVAAMPAHLTERWGRVSEPLAMERKEGGMMAERKEGG